MPRGEWDRWDKRQTVENTHDLDIRALCRRGLREGGVVVVAWARGGWLSAVTFELIEVQLIEDGWTIAIEYATKDGPVSERVEVERTACNYGGERLWWACPACGRRCAILYLGRWQFERRLCGGLTHASSQSSRWIRSVRKSSKLAARIGLEPGETCSRNLRVSEALSSAGQPRALQLSKRGNPLPTAPTTDGPTTGWVSRMAKSRAAPTGALRLAYVSAPGLCRPFGRCRCGGVHCVELVRRRGVESITRHEEVSMHPKMMIALANEVQRSRESERQQVKLRSLALAHGARGSEGPHVASGFARRLLAGISLRPRLS